MIRVTSEPEPHATVQRRYALMRVEKGDYLLPSNDAKTLWRISSYFENGSLSVRTDEGEKVIKGTFWQCERYVGLAATEMDWTEQQLPDDVLDPDQRDRYWRTWEWLLPTRAAAIDSALRASL
jgi:hypothetical protein